MDAAPGTDLRVNGLLTTVEADAGTPLLYVLRNDLGLTATRYGCGDGECGACTVLVDGRPVPSCQLPISAIGGAAVTTAEALGTPEAPHPLQTAFLELQAGQCGYCLSGVLLSSAALLAANPAPTRDEIRGALRGVLCRCGAHDRMVRAVERAVVSMRPAAPTSPVTPTDPPAAPPTPSPPSS
jgi:nicotinate dehydrogenase subunit A